MIRLVFFLIVATVIIVAIVRVKMCASVLELHGTKKKQSKEDVKKAMKRGDNIVHEESQYIIIQNNDRFVLWLSDDIWGIREFHITTNGNYSKSFNLSNGEKIRIIIVKGEFRLQQNGDEIVFYA